MNEQVTFNRILEEYELQLEASADDAAGVAPHVLAEFMRRYPQHAERLMSYAAAAALDEASPESAPDEKAEAAFVRRATDIAAALLAARPSAGVEPAMMSLRKAAERRGLTLQRLALTTNLTLPLVAKLDRCLIRFASIPRTVIERLAEATGQTTETVALYLRGDARFATGAAFRADEAPRMPDQQDFFEAIETDMTISDERKQEWRRLKNEAAVKERSDG